MSKFKKLHESLFNQKGIGLIAVMIAAALVVIAAMVVSDFIVDQNRSGTKMQISGDCQNIANSIVEYIKKDETSLYITSYGANSQKEYSAGLDTTIDGKDRFAFGPTPIKLFIPPNPADPHPSFNGLGNTGNEKLPATWKYYNNFNIKNSINRLVALAASENYCCDGLNMNDPNCGARFYDDATPVPGFTISDRDVEVNLGVDFDGSACVANKLAMTNIPDSKVASIANFKVRVTMRKGTPLEKTCEGSGTVQRTLDTNSTLTVLKYDSADLCEPGVVSPAICGTVAPVTIQLRTVKNRTGNVCETSCLSQASNQTCAAAAGGGVNLFNTFSHASCLAECFESEPGTAFLCKIGVTNWFNDAASQGFWEPCETATVHDTDWSSAGDVNISFVQTAGDDSSQKTSNAVLTLNNLKPQRGYVVDVRAVDTAGNIGKSFCGPGASPSCAAGSHFVIIDSTPSIGVISDSARFVDAPTLALGGSTALTSLPGYGGALAPFVGKKYQCQPGQPSFSVPIIYTPAPPAGVDLGHTCVATLTNPGGAVTPAGCACATSGCTVTPASLTATGQYQFTMTSLNNACGAITPPPPQPWCLDSNPGVAISTNPNQNFTSSTPNFNTSINYPGIGAKACGVATLCPNLDGSFTSVESPGTCTVPGGWSPPANSGCLQDPLTNYCAIVIDPCGHFSESRTATTINYSTPTAAGGSHQCFSFGGAQVGGNSCESGSNCTRTGQCQSGCAKGGNFCSVSTQCDDASYGVTSAQPGGPACVANACTCPSNNSTPAAANCSSVYCPTLNSCRPPAAGPTVGSAPPPAVACQACDLWPDPAWGLCIGGFRNRVVTCPGTCCIGPQPAQQITCPDCVDPWGQDLLHGNSVTAYQTNTVACGSTCTSESRTCNNGVVSGSFTSQTCNVAACAACNLPWGGTIAHGQSVTAYGSASVGCGGDCNTVVETRTCTNGVLSGSAGYGSCSVAACAGCNLPWGGSIANGASVTGYGSASVACGGNCATVAETRTCTNGVLSGSAGYGSCTVSSCGNVSDPCGGSPLTCAADGELVYPACCVLGCNYGPGPSGRVQDFRCRNGPSGWYLEFICPGNLQECQ